MAATRNSLTEKIETLEDKVVHSMQDATAVLHDTIDSARDVVHETVSTVKSAVTSTGDMVKSSVASVKESFDLPLQIQRHPWAAVGTAVAAGFVVGSLMESSRTASHSTSDGKDHSYAKPAMSSFASEPAKSSEASHSHGNISSAVVKHLEPLKGLAIGAAMSVVRNLVAKGLHEDWSKPVFEAIDEITKELGGRPMAKSGDANKGGKQYGTV